MNRCRIGLFSISTRNTADTRNHAFCITFIVALLILFSFDAQARRNFEEPEEGGERNSYKRLCLNHSTAVRALNRRGCLQSGSADQRKAMEYLVRGLRRCNRAQKLLRFIDEVEPLLSRVRAEGIGDFMNGESVTNVDGRRVTLQGLRAAANAQAERKERIEKIWGIMNANLDELQASLSEYHHLVRGSGDASHRLKFEGPCKDILMPNDPRKSRQNVEVLRTELKRIGGEVHMRQKVLSVVRGVDDIRNEQIFFTEAQLDESIRSARSIYGTPDLVGTLGFVDPKQGYEADWTLGKVVEENGVRYYFATDAEGNKFAVAQYANGSIMRTQLEPDADITGDISAKVVGSLNHAGNQNGLEVFDPDGRSLSYTNFSDADATARYAMSDPSQEIDAAFSVAGIDGIGDPLNLDGEALAKEALFGENVGEVINVGAPSPDDDPELWKTFYSSDGTAMKLTEGEIAHAYLTDPIMRLSPTTASAGLLSWLEKNNAADAPAMTREILRSCQEQTTYFSECVYTMAATYAQETTYGANKNVVSVDGARGWMQMLPNTASTYHSAAASHCGVTSNNVAWLLKNDLCYSVRTAYLYHKESAEKFEYSWASPTQFSGYFAGQYYKSIRNRNRQNLNADQLRSVASGRYARAYITGTNQYVQGMSDYIRQMNERLLKDQMRMTASLDLPLN